MQERQEPCHSNSGVISSDLTSFAPQTVVQARAQDAADDGLAQRIERP